MAAWSSAGFFCRYDPRDLNPVAWVSMPRLTRVLLYEERLPIQLESPPPSYDLSSSPGTFARLSRVMYGGGVFLFPASSSNCCGSGDSGESSRPGMLTFSFVICMAGLFGREDEGLRWERMKPVKRASQKRGLGLYCSNAPRVRACVPAGRHYGKGDVRRRRSELLANPVGLCIGSNLSKRFWSVRWLKTLLRWLGNPT